jgi:hypothetical protein
MSRLVLRAAALVFVAATIAGCDLRTLSNRTIHSTGTTKSEHCVRRILTRPTGNC